MRELILGKLKETGLVNSQTLTIVLQNITSSCARKWNARSKVGAPMTRFVETGATTTAVAAAKWKSASIKSGSEAKVKNCVICVNHLCFLSFSFDQNKKRPTRKVITCGSLFNLICQINQKWFLASLVEWEWDKYVAEFNPGTRTLLLVLT